MLDNGTKTRINTARDILVGKVPDPKAQVEQITTALIYKFMHDMDQESVELGGKPSFFVEEYAQYNWSNLMDKRLGGHQRLDLYVQAITRMGQNPHIPQLFRDIFKDAFLPYRDPETLNLFLKEIDGFSYDHSERLGDAFEYLLSVLGSQGAAGQFRTPRHSIDFIVQAVSPTKTDTILDPACGTAGFLISAFKYIMSENTETPLTPDERQHLTRNFMGYDISPDMVRLSLVNMYLHNFQQPTIYEYDSLTSENRWDDSFDVILANPPFMSPKGGIRPHQRFSIQSSRSEVLFVDYIVEHLNPNGRAGVIVPEGIIFQSNNAYKSLRKMLVDEHYLWAVISLPAGVFNPYSGVKTSILLMDNTLAKRADRILFVNVQNDGFDLGANRREVNQDDLPQALRVIQAYQVDPRMEIDSPIANAVPKDKIAEDGDYNLSGGRYHEIITYLKVQWPLVELGDLFSEIRNGVNVKQTHEIGKYRVSRIQSISDGEFNIENTRWTNDEVKNSHFLQEGDVLFSHINSYEHLAKTAFFSSKERVIHGTNLVKFRPSKDQIVPMYALYIFKSSLFRDLAKKFAQRAVNQASIRVSDLKAIKIPLPPIEVQRSIVEEIDSYQAIIDGARQVVEGYVPKINIDPDWKFTELGNLFERTTENLLPKDHSGHVLYISLGNIESGTGRITSNLDTEYSQIKSIKSKFQSNDILYGKLRPNLNKVYLAMFSGICSTDIFVLRKNIPEVFPEYYAIYFRSNIFNTEVLKGLSGAQLPRVGWKYFSSIQIPHPPLETQKKIFDQINSEHVLVESNRQLIDIFQTKIDVAIARVWGE